MLNLVEVCPSNVFSSVATSIFRQKYGNYKIDIWSKDTFNHGKVLIYTEFDTFEVNDFQMSLQLIKYVGNAIQRLELKTAFISAAECTVLNQNMDKYAGDGLVYLDLGVIKEDTFVHFTLPFEKIEELIFQVQFMKHLRTDVLPLNQLFPNVRRLKI